MGFCACQYYSIHNECIFMLCVQYSCCSTSNREVVGPVIWYGAHVVCLCLCVCVFVLFFAALAVHAIHLDRAIWTEMDNIIMTAIINMTASQSGREKKHIGSAHMFFDRIKPITTLDTLCVSVCVCRRRTLFQFLQSVIHIIYCIIHKKPEVLFPWAGFFDIFHSSSIFHSCLFSTRSQFPSFSCIYFILFHHLFIIRLCQKGFISFLSHSPTRAPAILFRYTLSYLKYDWFQRCLSHLLRTHPKHGTATRISHIRKYVWPKSGAKAHFSPFVCLWVSTVVFRHGFFFPLVFL